MFSSCGNEKNEIPSGIIPADKMIEVITEVELTQALIKLKYSHQDTINQKQLFTNVFEDFDTSEEQFNKSLTYYCKQPKLLMDMYVEVINNLSEKQAKIQ